MDEGLGEGGLSNLFLPYLLNLIPPGNLSCLCPEDTCD
jgi:hypothetical protein